MENRSHKGTVEVRDGLNGAPVIAGYAAVFNRDSSDMGFIEQVDPRAFDKTIREADVRGLGNHDVNWLLGRSKASTLRLSVDQIGLRYEIDVNQADPDGVRAVEKVRRGDWDGSSFSFQAVRDEWNWEANPPQRRLLEVALIDVGPVTFPAYPDATAATRSALEPIAKRSGKDVDELVTALRAGEIRSLLEPEVLTTEPPPGEERAGKVLSSASTAKVQAAHDHVMAAVGALRDLLQQAKEDDSIDSAKEQDSLRSALAAIGASLEGRADIPSLDALVDMYQCGEAFLGSENGIDDEDDRRAMYAILASLDKLIEVEAVEEQAPTPIVESDSYSFAAEARLRLREREMSELQHLAA